MKPNKLYNVDLREYHAQLDKKHQEVCKKHNITLDRLAEIRLIKEPWSVERANWLLNLNSITKLDYLCACKVINEC